MLARRAEIVVVLRASRSVTLLVGLMACSYVRGAWALPVKARLTFRACCPRRDCHDLSYKGLLNPVHDTIMSVASQNRYLVRVSRILPSCVSGTDRQAIRHCHVMRGDGQSTASNLVQSPTGHSHALHCRWVGVCWSPWMHRGPWLPNDDMRRVERGAKPTARGLYSCHDTPWTESLHWCVDCKGDHAIGRPWSAHTLGIPGLARPRNDWNPGSQTSYAGHPERVGK